jgi:hypothetical protein
MSYNIFDAAKDAFAGKLELVDDEIAQSRMDICNACEAKNDLNICTACGCFLPAKTKLAKSECPMEKWGPYISK